MAASRFETQQYTSEEFVESAGAVVFHLSSRRICLIHHLERDEWLLAKGRRNVSETRQQAALREVEEETGLECRLLPVDMSTRATSATDSAQILDETRPGSALCESFMVTLRRLNDGRGDLKIIWWYIAAVKKDSDQGQNDGEAMYEPRMFSFSDALDKLTFELDRDVVRRAISLYSATHETPTTR